VFKTGLEDLVEKVAGAGTSALPAPGLGVRAGDVWRGAKKTLRRGAIAAGIGGAGALALGAGLEHEHAKKRDSLVYAPMTGSFSS